MSTFNKVVLVGNLGDDPQTNHFEGGNQITNISIATTESWNDKQTGEKKSLTEWTRVVFRNKLSELADKYLKKGSKVLIEGKLRTRKWTDNQNIDRYITEVHANNMVFLSSSNQSNDNQGSAVDKYQSKQSEQTNSFADGDNHEKDEDEDSLPF